MVDSVAAQFRGSERMHGHTRRTARQQVCACGLELACTRAQKRKPQILIGDLAMYLVQQARNPCATAVVCQSRVFFFQRA